MTTREKPVAEKVGDLNRYRDRVEEVLAARVALRELEHRAAKAIDELGGDPLGCLPMWSAGREEAF